MKPQLFYLDDFDECLRQSNGSLYSMITVQLHLKNISNPGKIWKTIQEKSVNDKSYRYDLLRHGICIPRDCWNYHETISECMERIYNKRYEHLGLGAQIVEERFETKKKQDDFSVLDYIFLAFLAMYIIFVLLVSIWQKMEKTNSLNITTFDGKQQQSKSNGNCKNNLKNHLLSFSIFDNVKYILNHNNYENNVEDYMIYIQGIRSVTSCFVVAFHSLITEPATPVSNPTFVEKEIDRYYVSFFASNGGMWIQIFFVISSWFLTINFFRKLQKSGKIEFQYVLRCILKRYIRLTLPYLFVIALHITVLVHFGHSPFWSLQVIQESKVCQKNWWRNLLYVNNFDFHLNKTCLEHSWYLSVEFQLNILGLFILWLVQKKPKRIFAFTAVVVCFQIISMFYVLKSNNFEIAARGTPENVLYWEIFNSKETQSSWISTYSNLSGVASGLCFGYLYVYHSNKIFNKKHYTILWWITSWTLILFPPAFSTYHLSTEYYSRSPWFAAIYGSVYQTIFVFGIGLLIFGMSQGLGGGVKNVLELPIMHTLGQLSFGVYLIHFTFIKLDIGLRKSLHYVSYQNAILNVLKHLSISYVVSIMFTAFVINPTEKISRLII